MGSWFRSKKNETPPPSLSTSTYSGSDSYTPAATTLKKSIKEEDDVDSDPMTIKEKSTHRDTWKDIGGENFMTMDDLHHSAKKEPDQFDNASARMKAGNVDFHEINDEFMLADVDTFRQKYEPPHAVDLNDSELQKILDYERQRLLNKDRLLDDRMYEFIVNVSGATNTNLDRILPQSTVVNYERNQGVRYGPYRGIRPVIQGERDVAVRPAVSPVARGTIFSSPPAKRAAVSDIGPAPPTGRLPALPVVNEEAIRLAEEEREIRKGESRFRLATGYPWVEKIEVIGQMTLSPKIYFAANKAFTTIRGVNQLQSYLDIEDFHTLIYCDTFEIRILFADLTRLYIAHTDFFFPTRTPLDKNRDRIYQEIWNCLMQMANFEWLPNENRFRRKNSYNRSSRNDLLLKKL